MSYWDVRIRLLCLSRNDQISGSSYETNDLRQWTSSGPGQLKYRCCTPFDFDVSFVGVFHLVHLYLLCSASGAAAASVAAFFLPSGAAVLQCFLWLTRTTRLAKPRGSPWRVGVAQFRNFASVLWSRSSDQSSSHISPLPSFLLGVSIYSSIWCSLCVFTPPSSVPR